MSSVQRDSLRQIKIETFMSDNQDESGVNVRVRLKQEIKRLKIKQLELAEFLGVDTKTISRWQDSHSIPSDKLSLLSEKGIDIVYVLTGKRGPWHIDQEFLDYIARCLETMAAEVEREWTPVELLKSAVEVYHFFLDSGVERSSEQVARVVRLVISR